MNIIFVMGKLSNELCYQHDVSEGLLFLLLDFRTLNIHLGYALEIIMEIIW